VVAGKDFVSGWNTYARRDNSAFYAAVADKYSRYWNDSSAPEKIAELWYNLLRNRISAEMLRDVAPGKRVLNVGGRGWMERELTKQLLALEVVRTDLIPDPDEGVIQADAEALPFEDDNFDIVICRDVLEHLDHSSKAVSEAYRVIRPGGYYFATTPNCYNVAPDGIMHINAYSPDSFKREMMNAGFTVIACRGDCPNILNSLVPLSAMGYTNVLEEFKDLEVLQESSPIAYYTGTFMYLLCRKVAR
jgi:2-polyprenyl-3-methyl-5-hydroxy-6-metoxy-1,4-benzoquinol methylase